MKNEGGKEVLNKMLKAVKSTPEVKTTNTIVYFACLSTDGAMTSPSIL